jgi:3-oxoacyl-[acyl-carrier protein] reductase
MAKLEDRNILVTGAARGIGLAIATRCLEEGARVLMIDLKMADFEPVMETLRPYKSQTVFKACDVSDEGCVRQLFADLKTDPGSLDGLVNNAGITRDNLFMRMSIDQWQSVINVNLTGTYLMSRHACAMLRKSSAGRIVNLSSIAANGNPGQANYAASKAGVIGLTKTLALELARYGVTVNAVAPGFIETDMTKAIPEKARNAWIAKIPSGRIGQPVDVADAVIFLLSHAAAYITGTVIGVDGGLGL